MNGTAESRMRNERKHEVRFRLSAANGIHIYHRNYKNSQISFAVEREADHLSRGWYSCLKSSVCGNLSQMVKNILGISFSAGRPPLTVNAISVPCSAVQCFSILVLCRCGTYRKKGNMKESQQDITSPSILTQLRPGFL